MSLLDSILLNRSVTCMQTLGAHISQILGLIPSQPGALLGVIHEKVLPKVQLCAGRSERAVRMELHITIFTFYKLHYSM